jgi:hypothetical protein
VLGVINDNSEEFDGNNNPIINPGNVRRGANHMAEEDIAESIATRVKLQLTIAEWETIRAAVNNSATIPVDARRGTLGIPLRFTSASTASGEG